MDATSDLEDEFERIAAGHRAAHRARAARVVLGPSVVRVFAAGTKPGLQARLEQIPVDDLLTIVDADGFRTWYEEQLQSVATEIRKRDAKRARILPGIKWGHSAKVLSLFLRDLVEQCRYFTDAESRAIVPWLHVPVDSLVMKRLRRCGVALPVQQIKEIATAKQFYAIQDCLEAAAQRAGIPRVWFDDNWAKRVDDKE